MGHNNSYFNQLIFITVFILSNHFSELQAKNIDLNDDPICDTKICQQIADSMMESMVQTEDPCNDFYRYACGSWEKTTGRTHFNTILNETTHRLKEILETPWSPEGYPALSKAKVLYESCMDTDTIESRGVSSLSVLMNKYGGWPMAMTEFEWRFKKMPWQQVDAAFRKLAGISPLFSFRIMPDIKNSSSQIIWLTSAQSDNADEYVISAELSKPYDIFMSLPTVILYKNTMKTVAKLVAEDRSLYLSENVLEEDAKDVIKFEWELKLILLRNLTTKPDIADTYTKMPIKHFQRAYNLMFPTTTNAKIDWLLAIKQYFVDVLHIHILESEVIAVTPIDYFLKLSGLLDKTPSRVIVNTIHWWFVKSLGFYTNKEMVTTLEKLIPSAANPPKSKPLWIKCVLGNQMTHALAYTYVQKYFPEKAKESAVDMVHEILNGMRIEISSSTWLDDHSKDGALRKLKAMKEFVGYPNWYTTTAIDDYYKDLEVGKFYLENVLTLKKFTLVQSLQLFRQPVNKNKWLANPTAVNAFYFYPGNSLTIPAGISQIPFFGNEIPDAVNYGGLGTIIGHEISHGFDDVGCQFDEDGNVRNWWTNSTRSEYRNKAQCFIDKFHKYLVVHNNTMYRVNALNTLSENIADSTGVHAVHQAFQIHKQKSLTSRMRLPGLEKFNSDQLFFLSYAHTFCAYPNINTLIHQMQNDPHSPAAFRISGTLSNLKSFADAFQCAEGTTMNPVNKCSIW